MTPEPDYNNYTKEQLINEIKKFSQTAITNKTTKYGLVWENDKIREQIITDCKNKFPVFTEIKENAITSPLPPEGGTEEITSKIPLPEGEGQGVGSFSPLGVTHILIEGDNYHALTALNYTHAGKIDVIYIDPPYNTGNKDFVYNDSFVDKEDAYRHSKWLSFMAARLELAKNLLKDTGVIFISIDDNEQANLKLLCDIVFGENNFVAHIPIIMNLKGNQDEFGFAGTHEYCLVYAATKEKLQLNNFQISDEEELDEWETDEIGLYKKGATLKSTGEASDRESRPKMFYPILYSKKNKEITTITEQEYSRIYDDKTKKFDDIYLGELKEYYEKLDFIFVLPQIGNVLGRWRWGWSEANREKLKTDVIAITNKDEISFYKKQRPQLGDLPSKKPKSLFYKPEYSSGNGTAQLKNIFGDKIFNNPKPIELIRDFLEIASNKNSIILDFFAGSGTTMHAVIQLNAEDGGQRQCILVTNNENQICENVTYPRCQKVITGYTTPKGQTVKGLTNNNLRYFKTMFVENSNNPDQVKFELTESCTELLCLRENVFELYKATQDYKIFSATPPPAPPLLGGEFRRNFVSPLPEGRCDVSQGQGVGLKYVAIYYDFPSRSLQNLAHELAALQGEKKLYYFSLDNAKPTINFENLGVSIEPIPQKIIETYQNLMRK